jgi:hypothetical protein
MLDASWVPARTAEDHVDVADVIQLVAAALAHRDHREPAASRGLADTSTGHRQRGLQGGRGEIGELGGDHVDVQPAGQIPGRQP